MLEVTTGVVPSSMRVPWLEARMTHIQYRVCRVRQHDTVEENLEENKEDEESGNKGIRDKQG